MKKWLALILACMALGLVVAGCGSDDDDGGDGGASTEEPAGESAESTAEEGSGEGGGGGGASVGMKNIQFQPGDLTVDAGETITFTNNESIPHDVAKTKGPGPNFESGPEGGMSEGDTYELTLKNAGSYDYVCRVHAPGMAGTITVR
jgi:plastocyanin